MTAWREKKFAALNRFKKTIKSTHLLFLLLTVLLLLRAGGWAYQLPDTGQTKCYNNSTEITCPSPAEAFYGQDAQYNFHPRSYTKLDSSGNALPASATSWTMVRDNVTELIWEMKTDDGTIHDKDKTFTWCDTNNATNGGNPGTCGSGTGDVATDTEAFINALNSAHYGGYSDWRMPTVKEITTLVNSNIPYPGPTIDVVWFPNTMPSYYWSSNTYAYNNRFVWYVGFSGGYIEISHYKSYDYYVRAVRGSQTSGTLVINGDGTVTDNSTGLIWQEATAPGTYGWKGALAYCESLNLAGYTDWRLPDRHELQSLVDYSRYDPAIDPLLATDTVSSEYWTSTAATGHSDYAWNVVFGNGNIDYFNKSYSYYIRCVRSGQSGSSIMLDVPLYNQDNFGNGCTRDCSPTAGAMILGYYDSHGWPRMVPGGSASFNENPHGISRLVMDLSRTMEYQCNVGCASPDKVAPGLVTTATNMDPGAQFMNHSSLKIEDSNKDTAFQVLKGYIDNGWPILFSSQAGLNYYSIFDNSFISKGGDHSMVMTGYADDGSIRKLFFSTGLGAGKEKIWVNYDDLGATLSSLHIWITCIVPYGVSHQDTLPKSDFNSEGITDILWRQASTGKVVLWFMNSEGTRASANTLISDASWTVAGTGNFNSDGISDILWRQGSTGKVVLWFMNADGTRSVAKTLITDPTWTVAGTGDFNGDGIYDILWRQASTGRVVLWFMNSDGTRASAKILITDPIWILAGVGFFNSDGITDILWRNTYTGQVTIWFMNPDGTIASTKTLITDTTWTVAGTGDFNVDGISDILWRQGSSGKVTLWFMNADGTRSGTKTLITDPNWTIAGTGTFNTDSISDIIWRQVSTGKVVLWFMNADGTRASYRTLVTDPTWTVVGQ